MDDEKFEDMLEQTSIVVRKSFEEDWEIIKSEALIYNIKIPATLDPFDISSIRSFMDSLSPRDSYLRYKIKIHINLLTLCQKSKLI